MYSIFDENYFEKKKQNRSCRINKYFLEEIKVHFFNKLYIDDQVVVKESLDDRNCFKQKYF